MSRLSQLTISTNYILLIDMMRHEQIMELQRLIGSNVVVDSLRLLQDDNLEKARVLFLVVLDRAKVFDKNGIDPSDYSITFRLVDNVPEKGVYFVIVVYGFVDFYIGWHMAYRWMLMILLTLP
ncbi:hypothetical protein Tco_0811189 [Tanacetum coccineum]